MSWIGYTLCWYRIVKFKQHLVDISSHVNYILIFASYGDLTLVAHIYVFLSGCRFEISIDWAFVITLRWCSDLSIIRCVLFSTYALIVFYFIVLWLLFMQRFFTFIYDILYSWFLIFMTFTRSSEQVDFSIRTLLPRYVMKLSSFRLLYR